MKRLILSTSLVMLVAAAFAPIAAASTTGGQVSTTQSLPEGSSLTDLVRHNRDARGKS